jgi:hypothetical protein
VASVGKAHPSPYLEVLGDNLATVNVIENLVHKIWCTSLLGYVTQTPFVDIIVSSIQTNILGTNLYCDVYLHTYLSGIISEETFDPLIKANPSQRNVEHFVIQLYEKGRTGNAWSTVGNCWNFLPKSKLLVSH